MAPLAFNAKAIESMHSRVERAIQARRGVKSKQTDSGHLVGYTQNPASGRIHALGSIVSQLATGKGLSDGIQEENRRYQKLAGRGRRTILFIMDTSGSMLSAQRLAMVKGFVVSLLNDAYVTRTRLALISYGGAGAQLALPLTSSAEMAAKCIDSLKGGGSTPLLDAISLAIPLIERAHEEPCEIILLSDGRYNRQRGVASEEALRRFAAFCKKYRIPIMLIDAGGQNKTSKKRATFLAQVLQAQYRPLESLREQ